MFHNVSPDTNNTYAPRWHVRMREPCAGGFPVTCLYVRSTNGMRGCGTGLVLLACGQWDPGLVRRLPSRGAGAWCCAPLLRWRAQCPAAVCGALTADQGRGRRLLSSPPPLVAFCPSRPSQCAWRFVLSGCPVPSPAGTLFHVVCAYCGLGPVALWVRTPCPLCVHALSLPRCWRPLSPLFYLRFSRGPRAGRW